MGSEVKLDCFECYFTADNVIDFYSSKVAFPILPDSNYEGTYFYVEIEPKPLWWTFTLSSSSTEFSFTESWIFTSEELNWYLYGDGLYGSKGFS